MAEKEKELLLAIRELASGELSIRTSGQGSRAGFDFRLICMYLQSRCGPFFIIPSIIHCVVRDRGSSPTEIFKRSTP
jgi:hypothetical protein